MFKWIDKKITLWAVKRVKKSARGFVNGAGPTAYDPTGSIGGWIYGDDWLIIFASEKCKNLCASVAELADAPVSKTGGKP